MPEALGAPEALEAPEALPQCRLKPEALEPPEAPEALPAVAPVEWSRRKQAQEHFCCQAVVLQGLLKPLKPVLLEVPSLLEVPPPPLAWLWVEPQCASTVHLLRQPSGGALDSYYQHWMIVCSSPLHH